MFAIIIAEHLFHARLEKFDARGAWRTSGSLLLLLLLL